MVTTMLKGPESILSLYQSKPLSFPCVDNALYEEDSSPSPWTFYDGGAVYSHSPCISWVKHSSHHRPDVE